MSLIRQKKKKIKGTNMADVSYWVSSKILICIMEKDTLCKKMCSRSELFKQGPPKQHLFSWEIPEQPPSYS